MRSASALRHQTFDSNGPDVRVRGNAWQVYEKYQSLARDAAGAGDRVMAENYLQHAEHYYRIIEAIEDATAAELRQRQGSSPLTGQQPDMPSNYFTPDGQLSPTQGQKTDGQPSMGRGLIDETAQPQAAAPPLQQAEVRRKTPPAPTNTFFTQDDQEDQSSGPQTLVAGG
ncbi:MAG: DUF4167 domain-containing protein [Alphaproteobacteria bacterium]|nr:DUF4167 domain-containing protein [Alphaproteobacteria bacterium]